MTNYFRYSLSDIAEAIKTKKITSIDFMESLISRVDSRESELNEGVLFLKEQTAIHGEAEEVDGNQAALMALADLCHMLMSTNEFLYVE